MISLNMTRAEMIKWLGDAIRTETEKPFDKIDYDFVDECGQLLDKLMCDAPVTDELTDEMAKLLPNTAVPVQRKAGHKRLWRISLLAAVVLCLSITVLAVPQLRTMLFGALQLDIGETVEDDGVTYIYNGEHYHYDSMEALVSSEYWTILTPTNLPQNIHITSIWVTEDSQATVITFNDPTINLQVLHETNAIPADIANMAEKVSLNGFDTYIAQKGQSTDVVYTAHFFAEGDTYILVCSDRQQLISIVEAFTNGGIA